MDLEPVVPWLAAIALIISLGTSITALLTSGSKRNAQELDKIKNQMSLHERQIQRIEGELKHLPDHQVVNELKLAIENMRGVMGVQAETMASIARTVQRVEQFLLEKAK